jgi:CRP-like cAMP-binding protein
MASSNTRVFRNRLLAALTPADLARLAPHLVPITVPRRDKLELPNRRIETVYFLESGIASVVAASEPDTEVEIGIIGDEGMTGGAILHGSDRSPYSTYMQVGGDAHQIEAAILRDAAEASATLRTIFLRFSQAFLLQISQTAICNARATIEERLARWLLMAHDRLHSDEIPLTHEFLSLMMGARRPGVTEAINILSRKGLLSGGRGVITITDRPGLESRAGQYYGVPEKEYDRLLEKRTRGAVPTAPKTALA